LLAKSHILGAALARKNVPPQENVDAMHRCWPRLLLRDLEGYLSLYSSSVIHHGYSSRIRPGVAGLRDYYTALLKGFPDLRVNVEDIIAQGERVAHRFTFTGTHRGEFLDIAPTGNQISASGMQINLFSSGKCIEVWSVHDSYRFLTQIGAVPHLREKREQLPSKSVPAKSGR
jgi:predicted ester cyclase